MFKFFPDAHTKSLTKKPIKLSKSISFLAKKPTIPHIIFEKFSPSHAAHHIRKHAVQSKIDVYFPDRKIVPGVKPEKKKAERRVQTSLDKFFGPKSQQKADEVKEEECEKKEIKEKENKGVTQKTVRKLVIEDNE